MEGAFEGRLPRSPQPGTRVGAGTAPHPPAVGEHEGPAAAKRGAAPTPLGSPVDQTLQLRETLPWPRDLGERHLICSRVS